MSFKKSLLLITVTLFSLAASAQNLVSKDNLLKALFAVSDQSSDPRTPGPFKFGYYFLESYSLLAGGYIIYKGLSFEPVAQEYLLYNQTPAVLDEAAIGKITQRGVSAQTQFVIVIANEGAAPAASAMPASKFDVQENLGRFPLEREVPRSLRFPLVITGETKVNQLPRIFANWEAQQQAHVAVPSPAPNPMALATTASSAPETILFEDLPASYQLRNLQTTLDVLKAQNIPVGRVILRDFNWSRAYGTAYSARGALVVIYVGVNLANDISKGAIKKKINNYWE